VIVIFITPCIISGVTIEFSFVCKVMYTGTLDITKDTMVELFKLTDRGILDGKRFWNS
jgi:hypothetical protein